MAEASMAKRLWLAAAVLAAGIFLLHGVSHGEPVVPRMPLAAFPDQIGAWTGHEVPISGRILAAAGLDEYVSRVYTDPQGRSVTLFISYYRTQRTGETIHSPKNCLPGNGWQPLESRRLTIAIPGHPPLVVNEYVVARDVSRVLVLYWYQERGREMASEYAAKFWLTVDALTRHRTDGGLVRVTTPLGRDRAAAERRAVRFVRLMAPLLPRYIPN